MNISVIVLIILVILLIIVYFLYQKLNKNIYSTANVINKFFSKYCKDPAILDTKKFSWTENFRKNWKNICKEYLKYAETFQIPLHNKLNKYVASCDINGKWKTLYLRAYGIDTKISKYFPLTMSLINSCPCTLAYFSILEPGAKLEPHIGIYKGVIRYHLGLIIPEEWQKCFLKVNGEILHWREGSDLMFDDMFMHHVENNTNQSRIILFLDIKRDFHNVFLNAANSLFLKFVKSNDVLIGTVDNINSFVS